MKLRAEGRLDFATEDIFPASDPADEPGPIQLVFLTEAIVSF